MVEPFRFEPDTRIDKALELGETVVTAFRRLGLKCVDKRNEWCAAVEVETLTDAARLHEVPLDRILRELNGLNVPPRPAPAEGGSPPNP